MHSRGDRSAVRISHVADDETVSLGVNEILLVEVTRQSLLKTVRNPLLKIPN